MISDGADLNKKTRYLIGRAGKSCRLGATNTQHKQSVLTVEKKQNKTKKKQKEKNTREKPISDRFAIGTRKKRGKYENAYPRGLGFDTHQVFPS